MYTQHVIHVHTRLCGACDHAVKNRIDIYTDFTTKINVSVTNVIIDQMCSNHQYHTKYTTDVFLMLVSTKDVICYSTIPDTHQSISEDRSRGQLPFVPPPHTKHFHCRQHTVRLVFDANVLQRGVREAQFDAQVLPVLRYALCYRHQLTVFKSELWSGGL